MTELDTTSTEHHYIEPMPQLLTRAKTYTVNPIDRKSTRSHSIFIIICVAVSFSFACMIFLIHNGVVINGMLHEIDLTNKSDANYLPNKSNICLSSFRRQMLLVESWQQNGTREFFHQCSYQFPIGNSEFLSVCNTTAPSRPIYDLRFFVGDAKSFYPTVRGFSFNDRQARSIQKLLNNLLSDLEN